MGDPLQSNERRAGDVSGSSVIVSSEYLFSDYQATLADGAEIDSGWIDFGAVDKYQFEGRASVAGLTQVIDSSVISPATAGSTLTTTTTAPGSFQLFSVPPRQRYMRFRWQNNTGGPVSDASLALKVSYGSSDKHSVLSLNTEPVDFSQSILAQSVLYGLNEDTGQRKQVPLSKDDHLIVASGNRISQTGSRSRLEINVIDPTANTTLYSVPANHAFFATSIEITGINTSIASYLRARLRDGAAGETKAGISIEESQSGLGGVLKSDNTQRNLDGEPARFTDSVYWEVTDGVFLGDVIITGYLEPT